MEEYKIQLLISLLFSDYLDRNSITAGRDSGLQGDLKLTDRQYESCLSILYGEHTKETA